MKASVTTSHSRIVTADAETSARPYSRPTINLEPTDVVCQPVQLRQGMTVQGQCDSRPLTLFETAAERLADLCRATDFAERKNEVVSVFERLASPWAHQPIENVPTWRSHVVDDGTPIELSVGFEDMPELRVMVEPLGPERTAVSNTAAALNLLDSLASDFNVDLKRFEQIKAGFLPSAPQGGFSIWIATVFRHKRPPDFKIYLNPAAHGREMAPALVEEMLAILGFDDAWPVVAHSLMRRGPILDELKYVSLDLSRGAEARVKVYASHRRATAEDLEATASASPEHRPGDVRRFLATLVPETHEYTKRLPLTCYSFVRSSGAGPSTATTHFPINSYAVSDLDAARRIRSVMASMGLPQTTYARALDALARRPLETGIGMQSYASFRRDRGRGRLTVYFPLELYSPGTIAEPDPELSPKVYDA